MIKQCRFSDSVKFFEKGFKDRWKLKEYTNPNHIVNLIEQEMLNKELDLSVNNYLYTSDEWKIIR